MGQTALEDILKKYRQYNVEPEQIQSLLDVEIQKSGRKIIVLNDDPTGVQTVHGIYVFTDWSKETIKKGLLAPEKLFYILTNSRGLTEEQTIKLHRKIGANIVKAGEETGQEYLIVSRGDSTLRGHYPLETEILRNVLEEYGGKKTDGEILFPFFKEGGRLTAENIHYVNYNGTLVPTGDTEFAKDKTFGFTNSDLCRYIEEKSMGKYKAESVTSISLESLRSLDIDTIENQLMKVRDYNKVVVNALEYRDAYVFAIALYRAMAGGKSFMLRTAASFVKAIGGIKDKPLLTKADMISENNKNGGIIVVGSHTAKTTEQLEELKLLSNLEFLEFNSDLVLEDKLEEEVERVVLESQKLLERGITAVVYTRRRLLVLHDDTPEKALLRSVKISEGVQALVGNLKVKPGFVIAKGGITSSDIGVKALKVKQALVLGQAAPGIPVWKTDENSKFPGIPYIIFPGNVGEKTTLKEVVEILQGR